MNRPNIVDYFDKKVTLEDVQKEYDESPILFKYLVQLDLYIDKLEEEPKHTFEYKLERTNCKCKKFEGSTTVMCCNKCKLPLKNEPWHIPKPSVLLAEELEKAFSWYNANFEGIVKSEASDEEAVEFYLNFKHSK